MVCKKCGTINDDSCKFCQECGEELETKEQEVNNLYDDSVKVEEKEPNSNKLKIFIGLVLVIVVVASTILIINNIGKDDNDNDTSNSNETSNEISNVESNDVPVNSNVNSNITVPVSDKISAEDLKRINGNTVALNGYLIEVPAGYIVNSVNPTLQLISKNQHDLAVITIDASSYDMIKNSPVAIENYVTENGMVSNNIRTSVYNGVEFTTAEINSDGKNMILGYAKIDKKHVFGIMIANIDYTIDYVQFNTFATVVKNIKKA
jgi:cytoskeletal protein RodZ